MAVEGHEAQPLADLNEFRRDLLKVVDDLGTPHGLGIKEELERTYGVTEINHGRLYPALDDLVERGLITKSERDKRTNEYQITSRGARELEAHCNWYTRSRAD